MLAIAGKTFRVENESEKSELGTLASGLKEIGALKSLIAFLREGIKAKNEMSSDAAFEEHVEELIKSGREDLKKPVAKKEVAFEEELSKLTAEQKARYYALEAKCATIGSFIHPEGAFAKARKDFLEHTKRLKSIRIAAALLLKRLTLCSLCSRRSIGTIRLSSISSRLR